MRVTDPIVFEILSLGEAEVRLGDNKYVLREASGAVANKYRSAILQGTTLTHSSGKVSGDGSMISAGVQLVSDCLFLRVDDKTVPVSVDQILSWPDRVQQSLIERAKQLSDIDQPMTLDEINRQIAFLMHKKKALEELSLGKQ